VEIGRFLQRDPIGYIAGINLYAYVNNCPTRFADPYGLDTELEGEASWWNLLSWPGRIIQGVGWLAEETNIPIVKQAGRTVQDIGELGVSPATVIEGVVTFSGGKIVRGGEQFLEGTLETVGLGGFLFDEWVEPPWSGIKIPERFNEDIESASKEISTWDFVAQENMQNYGYKHWHMLSNAYTASRHGLIESLIVPLIGGIGHEIDPFAIGQEWERQGPWRWLVDTPGDLFANIMGHGGGLLLPEKTIPSYIRFLGSVIPGPRDPATMNKNCDIKEGVNK
jgi:hypothetical protein